MPRIGINRIGWPRRSSSTPPEQKVFYRLEENQQVKTKRNILNIEEIVGQLLLVVLDGGVVSPIDLSPAGRSRFDHPTLAVKGNLFHAFLFLVRNEWPRSDDVHVANENIEKLRQFIEVGTPQQSSPLVKRLSVNSAAG